MRPEWVLAGHLAPLALDLRKASLGKGTFAQANLYQNVYGYTEVSLNHCKQ